MLRNALPSQILQGKTSGGELWTRFFETISEIVLTASEKLLGFFLRLLGSAFTAEGMDLFFDAMDVGI